MLKRLASLLPLLALSAASQAHEGHGLPGVSHWHSTDVLGYAIVAAVAATVWLIRRK